jgi:hypothetical protein
MSAEPEPGGRVEPGVAGPPVAPEPELEETFDRPIEERHRDD